MAIRPRPDDPVLDFIFDPDTSNTVLDDQRSWPWSRLSASRLQYIGYKLVLLRCKQLGIKLPSPHEARHWRDER